MKRILVIAGGEWQVHLAKRIQELGYETVVSNLYEDSPAFRYANYCEVADVRDREKNLAIGRKYNVDAVVTDQSDIAVPTVAYVSEKLGLPTIGLDMAELYTNKYLMRCFCDCKHLEIPRYTLCESPEEVVAFFRSMGKTVIMKPIDSQSSRGVFTITSEADIYAHFEETISFSSDKKSAIVEEYINGPEFTVDGIVIDGRHYSLAISIKKHYPYNPNVASELLFSHSHQLYDYDVLREQNDRLVELSGLPFGITHAEYKHENGKFYLIEIAARGGGTRISSDIVPLLTGVDNYKILIESILGIQDGSVKVRTPVSKDRCAVLKFLDVEAEGQMVTDIQGVEKIQANPHVMEMRLEFKVGDRLQRANDDRSRVGFYIAYGETMDELQDTMKWVENTLKIRYEK